MSKTGKAQCTSMCGQLLITHIGLAQSI